MSGSVAVRPSGPVEGIRTSGTDSVPRASHEACSTGPAIASAGGWPPAGSIRISRLSLTEGYGRRGVLAAEAIRLGRPHQLEPIYCRMRRRGDPCVKAWNDVSNTCEWLPPCPWTASHSTLTPVLNHASSSFGPLPARPPSAGLLNGACNPRSVCNWSRLRCRSTAGWPVAETRWPWTNTSDWSLWSTSVKRLAVWSAKHWRRTAGEPPYRWQASAPWRTVIRQIASAAPTRTNASSESLPNSNRMSRLATLRPVHSIHLCRRWKR